MILQPPRSTLLPATPHTPTNNGSAAANRVTTTVGELADLALAKSGPATVSAAQTFSYTIDTANQGPSASSFVVVVDSLPAGVVFVSASNGGTDAGGVVHLPP